MDIQTLFVTPSGLLETGKQSLDMPSLEKVLPGYREAVRTRVIEKVESEKSTDTYGRLRLMISGPTGSGKSYLAYAIAHSLSYKYTVSKVLSPIRFFEFGYALLDHTSREGKPPLYILEDCHTLLSTMDTGDRNTALLQATDSKFSPTPMASWIFTSSGSFSSVLTRHDRLTLIALPWLKKDEAEHFLSEYHVPEILPKRDRDYSLAELYAKIPAGGPGSESKNIEQF